MTGEKSTKSALASIRLRYLPVSVLLLLCACSTVQTTDLPPDELRLQIADGEQFQPGDRVTIATSDGQRREVRVAHIDSTHVSGELVVVGEQEQIDPNTLEPVPVEETLAVEIPIDDIVAVEWEELTPAGAAAVGTGAAVAGTGLLYVLYVLLPALIVGAAAGL